MSEPALRPVAVYDVPLNDDATVLHPERVLLNFGSSSVIDIGALCYLSRETGIAWKGRGARTGRRVVLESLETTRQIRVRALISHISKKARYSGKRVATIAEDTARFVRFMAWADVNGHSAALNGETPARVALREYAQHMKERVSLHQISIRSGTTLVANAIAFLGEFLGIDNLGMGISLFRSNHRQEGTLPPSEHDTGKAIALCETLFKGVAEFLLEQAPYPHRLPMPAYLPWAKDGLWIFPTLQWCMAPSALAKRGRNIKRSWAYDYANGRLTPLEEHNGYREAAQALRDAEAQIARANKDPHDVRRRLLGFRVACNAFLLLFVAHTGMNWSQLRDLPWDDTYEVGVERQGFRGVKWRAGGRDVFFEIPQKFMSSFRLYLKLRDYLLNGTACNWLFFSQGTSGSLPPGQIDYGLNGVFAMLRRIDPELRDVTPREWRAAKSDWLIKTTDVATTALILQNSESTVLAAYAAGSPTSHVEEMGNYLAQVSAALVRHKRDGIEQGVEKVVGACSAQGKPHPVSGPVPVQPNCRDPEGCLFCDKHSVCADELDTRKLLSYQYVIGKTSHIFNNSPAFEQIIGQILARIKQILAQIAQTDEPMVKRLRSEVLEEGALHPYWADQLEDYRQLGVVV